MNWYLEGAVSLKLVVESPAGGMKGAKESCELLGGRDYANQDGKTVV